MKGVITKKKKKTYNTPHRGCIVKTRLTEEERQDFEEKCRALSISQSEYLRQAIFFGKVSTTIKVTANNEEMLTAVSNLVAQYGKIGSNLNQIARHFNSGGIHSQRMLKAIGQSVARIYEMKYEVLKMAGDFQAVSGGRSHGNPETHSE